MNLLNKILSKFKPQEKPKMSKFSSQENLETLREEYAFVSATIGYYRTRFNYYARTNGPTEATNALQKLLAEQLDLSIKIDYLTELLTD